MSEVHVHHQPTDIQQYFPNSFTPKPVSMVSLKQKTEDFDSHSCSMSCSGETQDTPSLRLTHGRKAKGTVFTSDFYKVLTY